MKKLISLAALCGLMVLGGGAAHAEFGELCEGSKNVAVCMHMNTLRAQLHALDAQRELMQVNPTYLQALGVSIANNANETLKIIDPGIPEHRTGLAGAARMGQELASKAARGDARMMATANSVRSNCATCHSEINPPNGIGWYDIFRYDWSQIAYRCSQFGKNPYLCKSMNGLLSAHAYHRTSYEAKIEDYDLTREAALEMVRILEDLKKQGFRHLPEKRREDAIASAQEVVDMARARDSAVFEKSRTLMNACMQCHAERKGDEASGGIAKKLQKNLSNQFAVRK